ncbi:MAG: DUF4157 domain-containing protein [Flavipsychrobacter sp.]|nr:DUF4157 domain-containing protein [Flavipsychrobacter sp.]
MGFIGKTNSSTAGQSQPFSLSNVQTKLSVSKAEDAAEKEADSVAKRVVDDQKNKKADAQKTDGKKDEPAPAAQPEPAPEPQKEGIQAKEKPKEDKQEAQKKGDEKEEPKAAKKDAGAEKEKVSKKDDKKQEAQKKSEEKEEPKAAKKDAGAEKEKVSKKDDKKQEAKKKSEEKEEKKAAKKDAGAEKDKVSKKEDKKQEAQKKGDEKEKKVAKKEAAGDNKDKIAKKEGPSDKKPVDKEKDTNVKPQSISRKEVAGAAAPAIMQKPQQSAPANALSRSEGAGGQQAKDDPESDEAKMQAIEQKINAKKGSGRPLNSQVKSDMESSFKYDFSEVKIHTDKESAELCGALNAHAFAVGNDIFFNSGKYDPESDAGKELLAHELTHVVQQKDTVQRAVAYRTAGGGAGGGGTTGIDEASKTITVSTVKLPRLKQRNSGKIEGNITRPKGYGRDPGLAQADVWKTGVEGAITTKINSKVQGVATDPDTGAYYFGKGSMKLFGTKETLIANSQIPMWTKAGRANAYDVDHIREMQLGGTNDTGNMELLNFSANRSSGSVVKNGIRRSVQEFLDAERVRTPTATLPTVDNALKDYDIKFNGAEYNESVSGNGEDFWSFEEITRGDHLDGFNPLSVEEIAEVKGSPLDPIVYTSEGGGSGLKEADFRALNGLSGIAFNFGSPTGDIAGRVAGTFNVSEKVVKPKPLNLNVYKMPGVLHGGYIKRRASGEGSLEKIISRLEVEGLSPIEVDFCDLVPGVGVVARGRVIPTVKVIEGVAIDFFIEGNTIELSKTFSSGELKSIPPPFKVTDAAVTVFAGSNGIGVRGNIDFEINNVGKGQITGSGSSTGLFELTGNFEFDKKIFDRADVAMKYTHSSEGEDKWEVTGNIQIPRGKISGVKRAGITVGYDGTTLTASGDAEFDIPGIEHGSLSVTYADEQMVIEGEVDLQHRAIKSGRINAKVEKTGDDYKVALSGTAKPNIPGIDTELTVSYNDGVVNITGTVDYTKGRLSGSATVGVTNQAVGADGQPSGGPGNDLTIYGSGSLTLRITDWLQGTAGVTFKPDGNVEVVGRIGIPAAVDIFPKKEINKDIFRAPTIEIPLFAIPVGTRSIGLVATIGGGAEAYASIGPGQLTEASVEVRYNPADEENMSITGNAKFRVPAEAGLRLFVRAGIGLSAGIARLAGGIELGGALGIEGAAEAGVTVNWSPSQGFKLDAEAALSVQPKFKFDVNAYLEAVLDLWVTEFRKEWRHNLAAFEWGPSMKFGVKFPIHYEENTPFDISLDDVEFEAPDINVGDFAKGIGQQLFG